MRQLAWLATAPEKSDPKDKRDPKSRMQVLRDKGEQPLMPHNPAEHLTDWLLDAGPTVHGAMGEVPIGYRDLLAWQEITGIELEPWEARLMRSLSEAYAAERSRARKRDCMAPYSGIDREPETVRDKVSRQVRSLFPRRPLPRAAR